MRMLLCLVVTCAGSTTYAQSDMQQWLKPELGDLKLSASYLSEHHFSEGVSGQDSDLGFTDHDLRLRMPISQDEWHELSVGTRIKVLDFDTDAWFPDTSSLLQRDEFPNQLWDLRLDTTYRRKLENGWIVGGQIEVGSPSDRPFASMEETALSANAFLRIPDGEQNAWVFFLNYASNREFWQHIPLPGVGYQYNPDPTFSALVGLPFSNVRWRPLEWLELDGSYFVPRTIRTRISVLPVSNVRLYAGYEWLNQRYLRHDRKDDDDRLFYYEQRVKGGVRWDIAEWAWIDFSGGYSFDRFFFEGERFGDRWDNRMNLGDGPFLGLRIVLTF